LGTLGVGLLLMGGLASPILAAGAPPVRVVSQGISILVPPPWENRTSLLARDPALAREVEAGGPPPILYLTAPAVEFFLPNLVLQRAPTTVGDLAPAQVLAVIHTELSHRIPKGDYRVTARLPVRVGGYPATGEELRGSLSGPVAGHTLTVAVRGQLFYIDVRGRLYLLGFTVPQSLWGQYQGAWVTMLRSLRFGA